MQSIPGMAFWSPRAAIFRSSETKVDVSWERVFFILRSVRILQYLGSEPCVTKNLFLPGVGKRGLSSFSRPGRGPELAIPNIHCKLLTKNQDNHTIE